MEEKRFWIKSFLEIPKHFSSLRLLCLFCNIYHELITVYIFFQSHLTKNLDIKAILGLA